MVLFAENPPMKKALRKRRRQEDKEEIAEQLTRPPPPIKLTFETNEESVDTRISTTEDDDDETPSAKFRRGRNSSYCYSEILYDGHEINLLLSSLGENLPSDLELGSNSEGSEDPIDEEDDGDWNMMGAALEREFLGLED